MGKIAVWLALWAPAAAFANVADHLVLSEIGFDPADETAPSAEYVEIMNPTDDAIDLSNVYLSDSETDYFEVVNGTVSLGTSTDAVHRFPAGASIPAGGVVVVASDSAAFLTELFPIGGLADFDALSGSPQLFETTQDGDGDAVPDMRTRSESSGTPVENVNGANGGECFTLFYWNGAGDLVFDYDHVCWRNLSAVIDKDTDAIGGVDGPDGGAIPSFYDDDAGTGVAGPDVGAAGESIQRATLHEPAEVLALGNGWTGHDESTEDWSTSWISDVAGPGAFEDCRAIDGFCGYGAWDPDAGACEPVRVQPDGTECADADLCDGTEVCDAGACVDAAEPTCPADENPCDAEECDPADGLCSHVPLDGTPCDDEVPPCTGSATCVAGVCGEAPCDDAGPDADSDSDSDSDSASDSDSETDVGSDGDSDSDTETAPDTDSASDTDTSVDTPAKDGGCGCRTNGTLGAAGLAAVALALVAVRRRRS